MNPVVYFDLEAGGLELHHPIIQLAAVAIDEYGVELGSYNQRLQFNIGDCDPYALELNHYTPEAWADAISLKEAVATFGNFLKKYKSVKCVSKRTGSPYMVARVGGYNAAAFDMPRLRNLFATQFLPAHAMVLDVLQLALWYFELFPNHKPENLKLATVCAYFEIPLERAHDALSDVRATGQLAVKLKRELIATNFGMRQVGLQ